MIERFEQMRKELNLTLEDIANTLGVAIGSISGWKKAGKIPGDRIYQIAEVFGVSADWLRTGVGDMKPKKSTDVKDLSEDELIIELVRRRVDRLSPEKKKLVLNFARELLAQNAENRPSENSNGGPNITTNVGKINGDFIQKF